jgi:hypothetical protein
MRTEVARMLVGEEKGVATRAAESKRRKNVYFNFFKKILYSVLNKF